VDYSTTHFCDRTYNIRNCCFQEKTTVASLDAPPVAPVALDIANKPGMFFNSKHPGVAPSQFLGGLLINL